MKSPTLNSLAQLHWALSDTSRLRVLNLLLMVGELCVCDIEATLEFSQSKASRHLNLLKRAGLVQDRREGTWAYYRLAEELNLAQESALAVAREMMAGDSRLRAEVELTRRRRKSPVCQDGSVESLNGGFR